jgi:hypothetical protein
MDVEKYFAIFMVFLLAFFFAVVGTCIYFSEQAVHDCEIKGGVYIHRDDICVKKQAVLQ